MSSINPGQSKLGILGGGQLGRMMSQACLNLDVRTIVLEEGESPPCAGVAQIIKGSVSDEHAVFELGRQVDALTIELEEVSVRGMERCAKAGVRIVPKPEHVALIQDKGKQKQMFHEYSIPTAPFVISSNPGELGFPVIQKVRTGGYDGRGVKLLRSTDDIAFPGECVLEHVIDIKTELSVIVARKDDREVRTYPCCEQIFDNDANIVTSIVCPVVSISRECAANAERVATELAHKIDFVGLLAVELFVTRDDQILVNELAPRCHNSGHQTIEANATSQFNQLVRIAFDLPLGDTTQLAPYAATINLLGDPLTPIGTPLYLNLDAALKLPRVYPHVYAKAIVKPKRKMGHVTVLADDLHSLQATIDQLRHTLRVVAAPSPR